MQSKNVVIQVNTDMARGADWQKIETSPTFVINNNAYNSSAVLRCLYSPFLHAYLIEYNISFTTQPHADRKVYINTGLQLTNPRQTTEQYLALAS